jgi:hypothetical protein
MRIGVAFGIVLGAAALLAACSSDGGGTPADAGADGTTVPGTDAAAGDVSTPVPDASPPNDSGGGGDDAPSGTDAAYSFDGFAKGDGNTCADNDGDGFTTCDGDCDDNDSRVNPCAFDTDALSGDPVGTDGKDNDCDGQVDNRRVCDGSLSFGHDTVATNYARAIDLCEPADPRCKTVVSATWYGPQSVLARRITNHMGAYVPRKGSAMAFFSTGIAKDLIDDPQHRPGDGTNLQTSFVHPSPLTAQQNVNPCGTGQSEANVAIRDYTEIRLVLRAPVNAGSFTFDFNFFSTEYPAYVCRGFNDTFLAMLTSKKYPNGYQIAFDGNGGRINVNNAFFQACTSIVAGDNLGYTHTCTLPLANLTNTGFEIPYCCTSLTNGNLNKGSGATDWLKTTAPVEPGEQFTLSFILFDEVDGILDSSVILDNFRWGSASLASPITAR